MSPSNVETLINLLMLLALFVGPGDLVDDQNTVAGAGVIAERVREARSAIRQSRPILTTTDRKRLSPPRLAPLRGIRRQTAALRREIPREIRKEMVRSGYRSHYRCQFFLPSSFASACFAAVPTVMLGQHIPMIGSFRSDARGHDGCFRDRHDASRIRDWVRGTRRRGRMAALCLMRSTCS